MSRLGEKKKEGQASILQWLILFSCASIFNSELVSRLDYRL